MREQYPEALAKRLLQLAWRYAAPDIENVLRLESFRVMPQTLTRREVLTYCTERLAKFKVPRRIEFRQSLPMTPLGKVQRRALAEEAAGGGAHEG